MSVVGCLCTVTLTYIAGTTQNSGAAANLAERNKKALYSDLTSSYALQFLAFETMGPWGEKIRKFVSQLGRPIQEVSEEKSATKFLRQRISSETQWGRHLCAWYFCG